MDLSAMTPAWYFKDTLRKKTQKCLVPIFHSLICLPFVNFSFTANKLTLALLMLPQELQSMSRLTTRADSFLFI